MVSNSTVAAIIRNALLPPGRKKILNSGILFLVRLSLPILFLLFVICFLLFVTPSFAQEITPTPSLQQVSLLDTSASTNPLDEILQRLEIPKILGKIFLAAVPLEVGQAADVAGNDWTFDASRNYFLDSSKDTSSENTTEIATTKKVDFIARVLLEARGLFDIFGNQKAKDYLTQSMPAGVGEKALKSMLPSEGSFAVAIGQAPESSQILGVQAKSLTGDEMVKSLPILQCAALPLTVGNCAKSNTLMEIPPVAPSAVPTSIPTITP